MATTQAKPVVSLTTRRQRRKERVKELKAEAKRGEDRAAGED